MNATRAFAAAGEAGGAARLAKERRLAAARAGLPRSVEAPLNPPPSAASYAGAGGALAQLAAAREQAKRDSSRYWASRAGGYERTARLEAEASARQVALKARGGAGGMRAGWHEPRQGWQQQQQQQQQPQQQQQQRQRRRQPAGQPAYSRRQRPHSAAAGGRPGGSRGPSGAAAAAVSQTQKALRTAVRRQGAQQAEQGFARGFTSASAGAATLASSAAFTFNGAQLTTAAAAQTTQRRPQTSGGGGTAGGGGGGRGGGGALAASANAREALLPHTSIDDIDPLENPPPGMIITLRDGKEISFDREAELRESLMALAPDGSGGMVSTKELLALLNSIGHPLDWDEQLEFMEEADPQHTGYVDIAALVSHIMRERSAMEDFGKLPAPRSPWPASVKPKRPAAIRGRRT